MTKACMLVLLVLATTVGCRRNETPEPAESKDRFLEQMLERWAKPRIRKIEILALKHEIPPAAVSNFVSDFLVEFPDPNRLLMLTLLAKSTNALPEVSISDKIKDFAYKHDIPISKIAAIVFDLEMWSDIGETSSRMGYVE